MQEWDVLVDTFAHVTDRLGMPIDPEIFETVVVLNALGMTTTMSCGGHLDERGLLLPWVEIELRTSTTRDLHAQYAIILGETNALQQELKVLRENQSKFSAIEAVQTR